MTYSPPVLRSTIDSSSNMIRSKVNDSATQLEKILERSNDPDAAIYASRLRAWTSAYIAGTIRRDDVVRMINNVIEELVQK